MVFKLERINRIREYETIFILKPELSEEEINQELETVSSIIAENGGELLKTTLMGKRKLFYEIKGHLRGVFVHIAYLGGNTLIPEFERRLRIKEEVIRYQTIKLVDHVTDKESRKEFYNSSKFEETVNVITKPTKEVKDDYDKFKPKGV